MAQTWRSGRGGGAARAARPLDEAALERTALRYVERYATTRAKLGSYLQRKLRERGWAGPGEPAIAGLVERFGELGYVDDEAFATARGAALTRRGYGPRRVAQALRAAGIGEEDAAPAEQSAREGGWEAALAFARRKRIGPFAMEAPDRPGRQKALAAMLRAGHDVVMARRLVSATPGDIPGWDE